MVLPVHAPHRKSVFEHPARVVTGAFAGAVTVGTALLALPVSSAGPGRMPVADALFTATSAITVTGLVVADPAEWSGFGNAVILVLIQLGGLGIMTLASLVLVGLSRRVGLRQRLVTQQEVGVLSLGEVGRVLRAVLLVSVVVEATVAAVLTGWFAVRYDEPMADAAWLGTFHAVSAFNNAGFAQFPDSLVRFAGDPVVNVAVMLAIVLGGLGVPVLGELAQDRLRWRRWSLHTKLVLTTTATLVVAGWVLVCAFEWTNPSTLGAMAPPEKAMVGLFQSVTTRTAGFNTIDFGLAREATLLLSSALMFIGAAPASTGGGIKVTTFAMLAFVILSEVRGDRDVTLFWRRMPEAAQRQALSIALVGVGVVFSATLVLIEIDGLGIGPTLFEVASAFGTVGLSTGITAEFEPGSRYLLMALMFAGRVGPLTLGASLALRNRDLRYRLPEERPLIG